MSWFGNRNREGHEAESPEVKPRNQILQTPEKETPESKGKLNQSERDKNKEFRDSFKCEPNESSENNSEKNKLKPKSEDPYKEERQLDTPTKNSPNNIDHEGR